MNHKNCWLGFDFMAHKKEEGELELATFTVEDLRQEFEDK